MEGISVLQSRIVIKPTDFAASVHFYEKVIGLSRAREWGYPPVCGIVYFTGGGHLELVGGGRGETVTGCALWLQVPDLDATFRRLARAEVHLVDRLERKPWGFLQMAVSDPDGLRIILVEVPPEHPLRRDRRVLLSDNGDDADRVE